MTEKKRHLKKINLRKMDPLQNTHMIAELYEKPIFYRPLLPQVLLIYCKQASYAFFSLPLFGVYADSPVSNTIWNHIRAIYK